MHIETKFSNGDNVFYATTRQERFEAPCYGGCDAGRLHIQGKDMTVACPDCYGRGHIARTKAAPSAQRLTIGEVRVEIAESNGTDNQWGGVLSYSGGSTETNYSPKRWRKESYMCVETGIGSGSIYDVEDLFVTEAEALGRAAWKLVEWQKREAEEQERRERERQQYAEQFEAEESQA
jgi:hypothetical protein